MFCPRVFLAFCTALIAVVAAEDDLYKILGVNRKATTKEIKQAYRRKALDTHPDKNKNVSPEQAAEAFHKVVHAFEVLSDENSRRDYDRGGRSSSNQWNRQQQRHGYRNFQWSFSRRQSRKSKDKFEVKEAQSRVMHIVSMEQLKTVMLDENDRLERNLLMCFATPQNNVETIADDHILFPYPFAAMSSQGIWWEDLLQTVKVRFHKKNDLTEFFGIPSGDELTKPIFVFGKRGQELSAGLPRFETSNRDQFHTWVWKQMEVAVVFINNHPHPVELYWVHGTSAKLSAVIEPNTKSFHTTMLSHEFYARDARVDSRKDSPGRHKLTSNSSLGSWKILSDKDGQEIHIEAKTCYDLSGHCIFWQRHGECKKNPVFMREACSKTCKLCNEEEKPSRHKKDEL